MLGLTITDQGYEAGLQPEPPMVSVKAPVFSMSKLVGVETYLGPEMKSTGEVMGIDITFERAITKALIASNMMLPTTGALLVTIADRDKPGAVPLLKKLARWGFTIFATSGTAKLMKDLGLPVTQVNKADEPEPNAYSIVANGTVNAVMNTVEEVAVSMRDGFEIRRSAVERRIPCYTSMDTAKAAVDALYHGVDDFNIATTSAYVKGEVAPTH
jgi:carbamoyl-phosphate synthase large subunit